MKGNLLVHCWSHPFLKNMTDDDNDNEEKKLTGQATQSVKHKIKNKKTKKNWPQYFPEHYTWKKNQKKIIFFSATLYPDVNHCKEDLVFFCIKKLHTSASCFSIICAKVVCVLGCQEIRKE